MIKYNKHKLFINVRYSVYIMSTNKGYTVQDDVIIINRSMTELDVFVKERFIEYEQIIRDDLKSK